VEEEQELSCPHRCQSRTVAHGFHSSIADFYIRFAVDALAGTSESVNAYAAISFLCAEYQPPWREQPAPIGSPATYRNERIFYIRSTARHVR
jgi:hypothetical protein